MDENILLEEIETILSRWTKDGPLKDIKFKKDNRIKARGLANYKTRTIKINFKKQPNIHTLRLTLLHELGHFYHEDNNDECDEYLAHKWAVEVIRVFYSDSYDYVVQTLKDTIEDEEFKMAHPEHHKAFERIYGELPKEEDKTVIKPDPLR